MPRPFARYSDRCNAFVRQWRVVVLLRRRPHTLKELAEELGCCQRTIRRDLYALQAVPLPVASKYPAGEGVDPWPLKGRRYNGKDIDANVWTIGVMAEWPRDEETPVRELPGLLSS